VPINDELVATFQQLSGRGYELVEAFERLAAGATLGQVIEQITMDRFRMGEGIHDMAQDLLTTGIMTEHRYRAVISRNYYAMYQAGRGVVFHTLRRDIDQHERMAEEIRKILGDAASDALNEWRRLRNEVDYSPYPNLGSETLEKCAQRSLTTATDFLKQCRTYLQGRGMTI
jgi:hypothetical protein